MTIINSIKRFEAEIDIETYVKDYVDVETFQACCKACPHYNTVWSCPPYDFNPLDYWWISSKSLQRKCTPWKKNFPARSHC